MQNDVCMALSMANSSANLITTTAKMEYEECLSPGSCNGGPDSVSSTNGRRRGRQSRDIDPDVKRQRFLERNRAAASRYVYTDGGAGGCCLIFVIESNLNVVSISRKTCLCVGIRKTLV